MSGEFLRVPGATWYRCAKAEIEEDENAAYWIRRYHDFHRMNGTITDLDEVPYIELEAFRIIEVARLDVTTKESKKKAKAAEAKRKAEEAAKGTGTGPRSRRSAGRGMSKARALISQRRR